MMNIPECVRKRAALQGLLVDSAWILDVPFCHLKRPVQTRSLDMVEM
jgi:hypothetical protein